MLCMTCNVHACCMEALHVHFERVLGQRTIAWCSVVGSGLLSLSSYHCTIFDGIGLHCDSAMRVPAAGLTHSCTRVDTVTSKTRLRCTDTGHKCATAFKARQRCASSLPRR